MREVTNAENGVWVVVLLYKAEHRTCDLLTSCLSQLAYRFPTTKFLKIVFSECIPGYPEHNLPTVLIYNDGSCKKHLVGMDQLGGHRATPETVAEILCSYGALHITDEECDRTVPAGASRERRHEFSEEEEEDKD